MKYFTKEWYATCQKTYLHFGLSPLASAGKYSEEMYQELYKKEEAKFVHFMRQVYDVDVTSLIYGSDIAFVPIEKYFEEHVEDDLVFLSPSEEQLKKNEELINKHKNRPPFNVDNAKSEFKSRKRFDGESGRFLLNKIPFSIRNKIADERVFLLGYATEEVIELLKQESDRNKIIMDEAFNKYNKYLEQAKIDEKLLNDLNFHDCEILSMKSNKNTVIEFNNSIGFSKYNILTLINSETVENDDQLIGETWLYSEIYKINKGYELHVLLTNLKYLTIKCDDFLIE